jgi:hypothetical protein
VRAGVLAHGIGGRSDLPIPFALAVWASAFVLLVSFAALAFLWPSPRLRGGKAGRPLPDGVARVLDSAALRWAVRLVGLAFFAWVAAAALLGIDDALNPTAGVVFVLFWVGTVAFASALLGPVWRWLNPVRTVYLLGAAALRRDAYEGLVPYPSRLGNWPASIGLLSFAWLELVAPNRDTLPVLRGYFVAYFGVMLIGAVVFGAHWFDRADGFQVASQLYGRLSVLGRRDDDTWVARSPLNGVAGIVPRAGLAGTVCVMLGSTVYDASANAPAWIRLEESNNALGSVTLGSIGLLTVVLVVGAMYAIAVWLAGRLGGEHERGLHNVFAHSIVPIALGYVVAHYWSLLILAGQSTFQQLADPLETGLNLFGLANRGIGYSLVTPSFVASLQVLAIVVGHVLGVVLAHDRAVSLFPRSRAVLGQLPLLCLMVGYTVAGLLLLFAA